MILPTYLPGRKDLKTIGFEGTHDYGYASFGYANEIQVNRPDGTTYPRTVIQWGACRDGFQGTPNETLLRGFCFTHTVRRSYDAACFLAKVEDMLGIPHTSYLVTEIDHITWAIPSPWWFSSEIRKSFYTLMLRAAYNYDHKYDNFDQALNSIAYIKSTKTAVNKFLNGYTVYEYEPKDACDHWFQQFAIAITNTSWVTNYVENTENIKKLRPSDELISHKAYELWMQNGCRMGYDRDNWLAAETLLREAV